jgi:hypothetical protein
MKNRGYWILAITIPEFFTWHTEYEEERAISLLICFSDSLQHL